MPVKKIFWKIEMNLFSSKIWYLVQMKVIYELKGIKKKKKILLIMTALIYWITNLIIKKNINTKKKR